VPERHVGGRRSSIDGSASSSALDFRWLPGRLVPWSVTCTREQQRFDALDAQGWHRGRMLIGRSGPESRNRCTGTCAADRRSVNDCCGYLCHAIGVGSGHQALL